MRTPLHALLCLSLGAIGCSTTGLATSRLDSSGLDSSGPEMSGDGGVSKPTCGRPALAAGADALTTLRHAMAATWNGNASTPAGWVPATLYTVQIAFSSDGTYTAHTTDQSGSLPFYYDQDPEADRWSLDSIDGSGGSGGSGSIYLEWLDSPDQLSAISTDADDTHLHFEYMHDGYGPVVYELDCGT